jgi:O-antigen ligase
VTGFVTRYLTLNQDTAFFRTLIWEFGSKAVMTNPMFGIGFEGYERPEWMLTESVDAHWLLLAMRFGLPAVIALGLSVIVALFALARASVKAPRVDQAFYRGIAISLFVLSLMMFTVTLWGGVLNWFNLLLGGCVACAQRSFR